jgi:membrane protein
VNRDGGWHRSVTGVVRRTVQAAVEDNVPFLASALSFDLLLTIPPFAILLLGIVGHLVQARLASGDIGIHALLGQFVPSLGSFAGLEGLLAGVVEHRGQLTLVGVPAFLWFSTRAFAGLRAALNEVFDTEDSRPWLLAKLLDAGLVGVTAALLLANAYISALGAAREAALSGVAGWAWRFALQLAAVFFSTLLFFVVFKVAPDRRIGWRTALVASACCAVAFEAAKRLFALYVATFATFDRFISDANVLGFFLSMLWVYFTCLLFLLGGEIAETYDLVRRRRAQGVRLA